MVASLSDLGSSSTTVAYFEREGYYAKNDPRHRRASFWHGEGAAALGLPRNVSPRAFERVLAGYVPGTEIRLGRARGGEHEHRPGLDLTLSAPKSVSLEALLYGNRQVLGAHDAAVRSTLDWVEAELLQTRGYDPSTGRRPRVAADGLVAAGFRHLTSRDQDPQLHTHCIIANMTRNRAGEWRSVEPTEIRRDVKLIGAYYRQELARRLIGLGYRTETTMIGGVPGFEIAGYPRALLDTFSSRRREILAWLDEHGLPYSAALTQQAALITRKRKVDKGLDTLKVEWKARAEEGTQHLNLRAALDGGGRDVEPPPQDAIPAWRGRSKDLRESALTLLGESPADTREMQAAVTRLADMPRLQGSVREVLDRLETLELRDEVADFRKLAATVEGRARRQETLPLHAEGYGQATAMAQTLVSRAALPEAARHEAAEWLDRDRSWNEELASAQKLTEAQERDVDTASLSEALRETLSEAFREAARLPAVRSAIRQESALLARSPTPEHWMAWTGDDPLVAGDRIAWRAGDRVHQAAVAFPGETGGMRASDTLLLRIVQPADGAALGDAGRIVEMRARDLRDADVRCTRAEWSDEGLRQLEAARQFSVPSAACPLACPEPVAGDRIAWTEAAGRNEEVRTVEAVVATRTETPDGHEIALRVIRASGPDAPEPGTSIQRTADEVTARGCFRAPWSDEARRAAELDPPKEVQEKTLKQDLGRSHGGGISM